MSFRFGIHFHKWGPWRLIGQDEEAGSVLQRKICEECGKIRQEWA